MSIESKGLTFSLFLLCLSSAASPADAQSRPSSGSVGEDYNVEVYYGWWNPTPELVIASESLGIAGTDVDLVNDLGIEQNRQSELRVVLRPATKHKLRFAYLPIKYDAETRLLRQFVFNGQRYTVGLPVATTVDLKTYRFGYEYDFFYSDRGYLGAVVELKYNDVNIQLDSPIGAEFTSQVAPIPTLGLAGRGYLTRNLAVTGEFSYLKVPESLSEDFGGRYFDIDIYGTVNFTNNVGAQLGYRTVDVFYEVDFDRGDLRFKGWYFGGVVRF
ncbi:MAG: hypothetical protein ABR606_10515 [Vicinamibacterales bacterium]